MIAGESRAALLGALAQLRDDDRLVLGCRYLLELTRGRDRRGARRPAGHREVAHLPRARAPARGGDAVTDLERALRELDVELARDAATCDAVMDAGAAEPREWPPRPTDRGGGAVAAAGGPRRDGRAARAPGGAFPRSAPAGAPALAYVAAALVILAGGTLAVSPEARSTVLRWLGLGASRSGASRRAPGVGREPRARRRRSTLPPRRAASRARSATPDAVYDDAAARRHHACLARLRRAAAGARADLPRERDAVHREDRRLGRRRRAADVDGATAYWITGSHGFAYQGAERRRLRGTAARGPHAARRARRAPAAVEGRAQPRPRGRDRTRLSSVTGPAASSPAARSDGPCAAAPRPTARRARR